MTPSKLFLLGPPDVSEIHRRVPASLCSKEKTTSILRFSIVSTNVNYKLRHSSRTSRMPAECCIYSHQSVSPFITNSLEHINFAQKYLIRHKYRNLLKMQNKIHRMQNSCLHRTARKTLFHMPVEQTASN